jgi:hypothetical protein
MATLESDKVAAALVTKLKCESTVDGDHVRFILKDEDGRILSRTKISHGRKHTIDDNLITQMTKQIRLGTSKNFVEFVQCTKSGEECLKIIKSLS